MSDIQQMLREIDMDVEFTRNVTGIAALDRPVMEAMGSVPRSEFVPADEQNRAYLNSPLPIGYKQTISQPYIVALMTHLLGPKPENTILEVGTGSGYQSAVLSLLVRQVYSMEIIEPLSEKASNNLQRLGFCNVECCIGNGYFGWPELAPFDGIIVTAAAPTIPPPLVDQLKPGARLVIPLGQASYHQKLVVVEKDENGDITIDDVLGVMFVPLTGGPEREL